MEDRQGGVSGAKGRDQLRPAFDQMLKDVIAPPRKFD